jgi:hypothetical protein
VRIDELNRRECIAFLARMRVGRLACEQDGQPYVTPFYFACYQDALYGFSTVGRGQSLTNALRHANFNACAKFEDPQPGDVLVSWLGGSAALYVAGHEEKVVRNLVEFLQGSDFTGTIFSRLKIEGTFPLEQIRINSPENAPEIVFSARWTLDRNWNGAPGMLWTDAMPGKGTHGSLCPTDMHNTLIAAGPDFKSGYVDHLPSGNTDVAPTILYLLDVPGPKDSPMQGRVLQEALVNGKKTDEKPTTRTLQASRDVGIFRWSQYLKVSEYGGVTYFDEGNGQAIWK